MVPIDKYLIHRKQPLIELDHAETIVNINILLAKYGLKVTTYSDSPGLTTYYVRLNVDSKINALLRMENNFAIACDDSYTRVYQRGCLLCIETQGAPNTVYMTDLITDEFKKGTLPMMLGVDNFGVNQYFDLATAPHVLIAGETGSGKSILLHVMLTSLLLQKWDDVELVLIDAKKTELVEYHALENAEVIINVRDASRKLRDLCREMDDRYAKFAAAGCRDIESYQAQGRKMKRIVCAIDEFADLIMTNSDVEEYVVRLAQKARACGIHLIICTQRPSADVVTGLIKSNIPTKIALSVSNAVNSRIIIDDKGAEKLHGHGDMLFFGNGMKNPIRIQGCYTTAREIHNIVMYTHARFKPEFAVRACLA